MVMIQDKAVVLSEMRRVNGVEQAFPICFNWHCNEATIFCYLGKCFVCFDSGSALSFLLGIAFIEM